MHAIVSADENSLLEACAGQQRLLRVISRLSALGNRELPGETLARLEAVVSELESPAGLFTGLRKRDLYIGLGARDCISDTSSELSWASDLSAARAIDRSPLRELMGEALTPSFGLQRWEAWKTPQEVHYEDSNETPEWTGGAAVPQPCFPEDSSLRYALAEVAPPIAQAAPTVDIDVVVPHGVAEGWQMPVDYAGLRYEVTVPPGYTVGSTFRVTILAGGPW